MHGNTFEAPSGHNTRRFADILAEAAGFFGVHEALGTACLAFLVSEMFNPGGPGVVPPDAAANAAARGASHSDSPA